jgi:CheY-like chemotaxis protein
MNILFLEDRGSVSFYLKQNLENFGYSVFEASSIPEANSIWEEVKIDCLIVDLNLTPDGLTEEEIDMTHNGILTGWVWLKQYIFPEQPSIRKKTIILSEYLSELDKLGDPDASLVTRIKKRAYPSPIDEIQSRLKTF